MVTVACVYKPGNGFTEDYVWRLRNSLKAQKVPYKFLCLTTEPSLNEALEDEAELIPNILPGWWNKMHLYRPGRFAGNVVYFDLDTMIVGDITDLLTYSGSKPLFLDDFNHTGNIGTGVIAWRGDAFASIYEHFMANWESLIKQFDRSGGSDRGDQAIMRRGVGVWQPAQSIQNGIYSYKKHIREHNYTKGTESVICFHGKPRPHEVGWIYE